MKTYYLVRMQNNSNAIYGNVDMPNYAAAVEFFRTKEVPLNDNGYWRENVTVSWTVAEKYNSYYPRPS